MIRKVSIIGVGLIGGSLSLALKRANPRITIVGYDKKDVLRRALRRGIIDRAAQNLEVAAQADVVILAVPVLTILQLIPKIARYVKSGTIVTDVGSVKSEIVKRAKKYFNEDINFIGGHPMAGSERQGIDAANPLLFTNAVYVLCPRKKIANGVMNRFTRLIETTGAQILFLEPEAHDKATAAVSHVPQLLAVALMNVVSSLNHNNQNVRKLAAGGFRDLTRIASSPYNVWNDILLTNRKEVSRALDRLIQRLKKYKSALKNFQTTYFEKEFVRSRRSREKIRK